MDKHLHIVCLDVPYPPDYGGVFDLFYKIKTLYSLGVKIHLHCFEYGRGEQKILNNYCEAVVYYKREKSIRKLFSAVPFIVGSRANKFLLKNLLKDNHPVLLEGIHCSYFLYTNELQNKKVFVRLHNVEFKYYKQLFKNEKSLLKKIFFLIESRLLKKYERKLLAKATCISVSQKDIEIYQKEFSINRIKYLPVFLPYDSITSKTGKGEYCLYHGNLSVNENEKAAIWLSTNIFSSLETPFIIAGKSPTKNLRAIIKKSKNIELIPDPSQEEMEKIISNAQINILPSFNTTGIKIKLLNALFNGRHCIVNKNAVDGTGLNSLCHIAHSAEEYISIIKKIMDVNFSSEEIELRKNILLKEFDNSNNARQLIQWIY